MTQTFLFCLLTLAASGIGTATGFGTSTVMIPIMVLFVPISFVGAYIAKRFLDRLPQKFFRIFVGVFLALVGIKLVLWA